MDSVQNFYESYHSSRRIQKRIIGEKNFTYRNLLMFINKYRDKEKNVLDIGSGVGTLAFYLASKGLKVTGIEISRKAVELAKENANLFGLGEKINFIPGNFPSKKPFGRFDLIICSEVIEHLRDDKRVVKAMYQLTKRKGVVILSTRSKNDPLYRIGLLKKFEKGVGHLRRYSVEDLKILFRESGFEILRSVKTEGILRNSLFIYSLVGFLIKLANRFNIISDFLTFLDSLTLPLGEAQIIIVAKRP